MVIDIPVCGPHGTLDLIPVLVLVARNLNPGVWLSQNVAGETDPEIGGETK